MIFLRLITLILTVASTAGTRSLRTAVCPSDTPTCNDGRGVQMCNKNQIDRCVTVRRKQVRVKRRGGSCGLCPDDLLENVECVVGKNECAKDEYCAVDDGQCLAESGPQVGQCSPLGDACDGGVQPVCGCDGKTYTNAACAKTAGKNVASQGDCGTENAACSFNGTGDDTCSDNDTFCRIGHGECKDEQSSWDGLCESKPKQCTREFAPVCGCDGYTHPTECFARAKGVNVMKNGIC